MSFNMRIPRRSVLVAWAICIALALCAIAVEPASAGPHSYRAAERGHHAHRHAFRKYWRRKWSRSWRRARRRGRGETEVAPQDDSTPPPTDTDTGSVTVTNVVSGAGDTASGLGGLADGVGGGGETALDGGLDGGIGSDPGGADSGLGLSDTGATESLLSNGVISIEDYLDIMSAGGDPEAVSSSMSNSRTALTIAGLPNLSKRLAKVSFQRNPSSARMVGGATGGAPAGAMGGGGFSGLGMTMSGFGSSAGGGFNFSGNLSGLREQSAMEELTRRFASFGNAVSESGLGEGLLMSLDGGAQKRRYDMWFGGSYSYFDASLGGVKQSGGVGTLQMGADTRLNDRMLVGVAVFGDVLRSKTSDGAESEGLGVMAGPYAVASLGEDTSLELMAAYGVAFNSINSSDAANSDYRSDRLLLSGRLSGDWSYGAWTIRPSTRITYYAERQNGFDAGDAGAVAAQTTELGQARAGPELAYEFVWDDGALRPHLAFEGVWAFEQTDKIVDGAAVPTGELSASFGMGVDAVLGDSTIRAVGRYDGIGDPNVDALTGEIVLRVPFD